MRKKKTIVIGLLAIIAVAVIAGGVVLALNNTTGNDYMSLISKGNRYMEKGDYDKAIVVFQTAISANDERTEGYEGLVNAYLSAGYTTMAKSTLVSGIENTGSTSLRLFMREMFDESDYEMKTEEGDGFDDIDIHTAEDRKDVDPMLNSTLLKFIAAATFGDYDQKYKVSAASVEAENYSFNVESLDLKITFSNSSSKNTINKNTGTPYREYMPSSIVVGNNSILFGTGNPITAEEIKALPEVKKFKQEENHVSFQAYGCEITLYTDNEGTILPESGNVITILTGSEADEDGDQSGSYLTGSVSSAKTGSGIAEAEVSAYAGFSASGTPVKTNTDSSGTYKLMLAGGDYHIVIEKEGYIKAEYDVYVLSSSFGTYEDFTISEEMSDDEIRIVLTWDSNPRDLDLYLRGDSADGAHINTCQYNKRDYDRNGNVAAELDVDDRDGNGPETITLYAVKGHYKITVIDFYDTGTISNCGANVKIYKGSSLVESIDICSGVDIIWDVAEINDGEVTILNRNSSEHATPGSK